MRQIPLRFLACWIAILAYQFATGTFRDDLFDNGDPPAHFVTGVMIADYVRTSLGTDPLAFAEQYYLRFPKVAFGRWPPLFHMLQAAAYLSFGASKATALVLVAGIAAALCTTVVRRTHRLYGGFTAVLALAVLLSFSEVRRHSLLVMSDLLTVLFCTLTAYAIADFIVLRRTRHLLLAGLWSGLALLTKETAIYLLLLAPTALACLDGRRALRDGRVWAFAASLVVLGVGFLFARLLSGAGLHGYRSVSQLVQSMTHLTDLRSVMASVVRIAPLFVIFLAGCGIALSAGRRTSVDVSVHVGLSVAWLAAMLVFFVVSPVPPGPRYLLPAVVPFTMLVAHVLHAMRESFQMSSQLMAYVVPSAVVAVVLCNSPATNYQPVRGYGAVARLIPIQPDVATLISSSAAGEGAFIAERLLADRTRQGIVLRSSKVLASSDWLGTDYRPLKHSVAEIHEYLREVPVRYIVLDTSTAGRRSAAPDCELLRQALEQHPQDYRQIGKYPLRAGDSEDADALVAYENLSAAGRPLSELQVALNHTLGRTLRLATNQRSQDSPATGCALGDRDLPHATADPRATPLGSQPGKTARVGRAP